MALDEQLAVVMGIYETHPQFAWDRYRVGDFLLGTGRKRKVQSDGVAKNLISNPAIIL